MKKLFFTLAILLIIQNTKAQHRTTLENSLYIEYGKSEVLTNKIFSIPGITSKCTYKPGVDLKIGITTIEFYLTRRYRPAFLGELSLNFTSLKLNENYLTKSLTHKYPEYEWKIVNTPQIENGLLSLDVGYRLKILKMFYIDCLLNYPLLAACFVQKIELKGESSRNTAEIIVERYDIKSNMLMKQFEHLSINLKFCLVQNNIGAYISYSPYFFFSRNTVTVKYKFPNESWEKDINIGVRGILHSINCGLLYNFQKS